MGINAGKRGTSGSYGPKGPKVVRPSGGSGGNKAVIPSTNPRRTPNGPGIGSGMKGPGTGKMGGDHG